MKIAILGHGVVGSGTREILEERGFTVKKILEKREIPEIKDRITDDFDEIISDEEIKIVVETIGGLEPAHTFAVKTLKAKKHFVTSNKFLMSEYFGELVSLAEENGVSVRFGASAGGGIPWIHNLSRCAKTDEITEICGIMNGTTNYILDAMERKGISFSDALKTAQSLGYAERDPSADVDGYDVARKVALSVAAGFGKIIKTEDIPTFSLKAVSLKDMAYIKEKTGRSIRYKGFAKDVIGGVSAFVEPTLVKAESLESRVSENGNLITLIGKNTGRLSFFGQGAGKYPTGDTVALDVVGVAEGEGFSHIGRKVFEVKNDGIKRKYYIRTSSPAVFPYIATEEERQNERYIFTDLISVSDIHKIYEETLGKNAFIAGVED